MALTFQDYTANGTAVSFAIPFDRIRDVHVKVFYGATEVTTGWSVAGNNVVFTSPPPNGTVVRVRRITDFTERLVDYVDGSRLNEVDLDTDSKQAFYLIQESRDINDVSMVKNSLGNWEAGFDRIQSVSDPLENNDAANKTYVDQTANNFANYGIAAPTTRWAFTGNGSSLIYTITGATLTSSTYYLVTVNGSVTDPAAYVVSPNTITFDSPPANGSAVVVVLLGYPRMTVENTVGTLSLQDGAVTPNKMASTLDLSSKTLTIPDGNVTASKLASTLNLSSKTLTLPNSVVQPSNCATNLFYNIAPVGSVIQTVQTKSGLVSASMATASNVIPLDSTIPQWSEGAFGYSVSITPIFSNSKLRITFSAGVQPSTIRWASISLFRETGTNALGASSSYISVAGAETIITFSCEDTAGTTSAITYNMRFGPEVVAGAGSTMTLNKHFGTANGNFFRVEEIKQ
jgi:hypothetical protein